MFIFCDYIKESDKKRGDIKKEHFNQSLVKCSHQEERRRRRNFPIPLFYSLLTFCQ
jgi:hypothetical protein